MKTIVNLLKITYPYIYRTLFNKKKVKERIRNRKVDTKFRLPPDS
jgi:hypothetical protein